MRWLVVAVGQDLEDEMEAAPDCQH